MGYNRHQTTMKRHPLTLFLALAASVGTLFAETYSGTCGTNLTWTFDTESGTLTISGTGAMTNYTYSYGKPTTPWQNYLSSIKTVIIEDGVTSIGGMAFCACSSLTSVTIPNSVTSIAGGAFYDCSSLTSVTIPNSVTSIAGSAFQNCSSLTSVTIPNSVTSIGNQAFEYCSSLTSVTIPNSVTSIGDWTFYKCRSLTSITIPNSVTSIGTDAFYNCSSLTSVTIGESVTSIGNYAFYDCTGLTSVTIPNSVTSIGGEAFEYCSSLTSVTIPNSVTSIGDYAFFNVPNIVYYGAASGSPWGARSLNGYVEVYLVYSDETKTKLLACSAAAQGEITIPNSVTSIGNYAFCECSSLTSVTIPNSVTSIGSSAFEYCSSLTFLTCEATNPPELENNGVGVFYGVDKSIPLYVPAQSIDLYKTTEQWKDFTNILPIPDVEPQKYTITWQDEDGNVIKTDQVAQGTTPAFTGTTPTKPATNEYTYEFAGWLPKIKPATENAKYTTFFERNKIETSVYTVNINGENCSLNINNQYPEGTVITLEAVADECFEFQQWSDGNKDNPRTITVTANTNLTAEFNKVRYTVTGEPSTGGKVQIRKQ